MRIVVRLHDATDVSGPVPAPDIDCEVICVSRREGPLDFTAIRFETPKGMRTNVVHTSRLRAYRRSD